LGRRVEAANVHAHRCVFGLAESLTGQRADAILVEADPEQLMVRLKQTT
jgi:hypothetical protein